MKKKTVKVLAAAMVMAVFFLMAAGSGSDNDGSGQKAITEKGTEDSAAPGESAADSGTESPAAANGLPTIEEQVLIDKDGLKITATGLSQDVIFGTGLKLLIENDTDKDLGIGCDALIVNDYMITELFSATVAAGKKSNETMHLLSNELEAAGIDNIGQIEIYFRTFDSSSYQTVESFDKVTVQTSEFANMDTKAMDDGKELYNQDGVRIVGKYVDENSFWGAAILLYLENNTGKNIGIGCDDMSVNGFMMTPLFSATVYDGKMSVNGITLMASELEENNITSIDEVELKFRIYDAQSYSTIAETDAISFSAQ